MSDIERTIKAKAFIDKLANGINPVNNEPIPEHDVINNSQIVRGLFYVSDILSQIIVSESPFKEKKAKKFPLNFEFYDTPLTITEFTKQLNSLVDGEIYSRITYRAIYTWLLSENYLKLITDENGKEVKRPTEAGEAIGISAVCRTGMRGDYTVLLYNREAQSFLIDNIDALITANKSRTIR